MYNIVFILLSKERNNIALNICCQAADALYLNVKHTISNINSDWSESTAPFKRSRIWSEPLSYITVS